jgi:hypothetical protein
MASASDDKGKMPPEDDHQDSQLKEEVESEAKEEEMEEDQSSRPSTMIASIGVATSADGGGYSSVAMAPEKSWWS